MSARFRFDRFFEPITILASGHKIPGFPTTTPEPRAIEEGMAHSIPAFRLNSLAAQA
ncbi:hypothetical protein K432DRAFT_377182 [Lepidopterella palustris CBS 459.81]|uniref:Uncharacterized protein n=1 Tax=Lepidopterella palustris CBS 459.81 TaxID=1314670 RepID=A0A8E2ELF5_9PEZI|nr:hypothetical protein K432DRAFT_377182 [Lepidopterella palustris CBS 459.81]